MTPRREPDHKRVAGYVRVSRVGGRSGDTFLSPEVQQQAVMRWVEYRRFQLVEWYVDLDVSASRRQPRPAFDRMISDAKAGRFDVIAVYRLTRFGRTMSETASTYDDLERSGIGLVSVTEDIDSTTATGAFVRNMLFAMADFEARRIGEEWSTVHANRRKRGLPHFSRGVYGYRVEGAVPVEIDQVEARVVRQVYQRRAAGASMQQLRQWLHEEGHQPRRGYEWFSQPSIRRMLSNPVYAGLVRVGDELISAQHEPIISRELWDQVQSLHRRQAALARHRTGLVAGVVVCASCGYRMNAWTTKGRRYYACRSHLFSNRGCPAPAAISQKKLDDYVEAALFRRVPNRKVTTRAGGQWRRRRDQLAAQRADLDRALDEITSDRFTRGTLPPDEYERQVQRLLDQRGRVQRELDEAEAVSAQTVPVIETWRDAWQETPLPDKQRLVRGVIVQVVVEPGRKGGPQPPLEERVRIEWAG